MMEIATGGPGEATPVDAGELETRLRGRVVGPEAPDWDAARAAWNLAVDQRPALVAEPETAADIAAVIDFARERGLRVAPQGTGHLAGPMGSLEGTILLKTSRMRALEVDPQTRTARVGAGITWGEVTPAAAEHGLAALAGSSHDVGVVGYTLGGGVSWLARKHGLACNSVRSIELVSADGGIREVSAQSDPDLFWALRGGGGNFGVVSSIELELFELDEVFAGALFFPLERAAEVLNAWREWTEQVPDEVTSIGRMLRLPPLEQIPEPVRGRSFTVIEACILGGAEQAERLLEPLRELGPEMDTFETIPAAELEKLHMDPPEPVPGLGDGLMLDDLSAETVNAISEAFQGEGGAALLSFELRHVGGALARAPEGAGALGALDGSYLSYGVGMVMSAEMAAAIGAGLARMAEALAPAGSGKRYLNFSEQRIDAASLFEAEALLRLRELRRRLDPDLILRTSHPID